MACTIDGKPQGTLIELTGRPDGDSTQALSENGANEGGGIICTWSAQEERAVVLNRVASSDSRRGLRMFYDQILGLDHAVGSFVADDGFADLSQT